MCKNPDRILEIAGNIPLHQIVFDRIMKTSDLDILQQSLRLIINISGHPRGLEAICGNNDIPFTFILAQTKSKCIEIQISALQFLSNLTQCRSDFYTYLFTDPLFLEEMYEILEVLLIDCIYLTQ